MKCSYIFCFCVYWNPPMLNIENQASLLITIHVKSLFVSLLPVVMIRAYTFTYVPITYTRDTFLLILFHVVKMYTSLDHVLIKKSTYIIVNSVSYDSMYIYADVQNYDDIPLTYILFIEWILCFFYLTDWSKYYEISLSLSLSLW